MHVCADVLDNIGPTSYVSTQKTHAHTHARTLMHTHSHTHTHTHANTRTLITTIPHHKHGAHMRRITLICCDYAGQGQHEEHDKKRYLSSKKVKPFNKKKILTAKSSKFEIHRLEKVESESELF